MVTADVQKLLRELTNEQKRELADLGISAARRSDWLHEKRLPTSAQLLTLAGVLDLDPAPLLLWHAKQEATPAQLDLFLRALARSTAALAVVILSGAGNHADAASMRVGGPNDALDGTHIMRSSRLAEPPFSVLGRSPHAGLLLSLKHRADEHQ